MQVCVHWILWRPLWRVVNAELPVSSYQPFCSIFFKGHVETSLQNIHGELIKKNVVALLVYK